MLEGYTKNLFSFDISYSKEEVVKTNDREFRFKIVLKSKIYKKDSWEGRIYGYNPEITSYHEEIELWSSVPGFDLQRCINITEGAFYEMKENILKNYFTK